MRATFVALTLVALIAWTGSAMGQNFFRDFFPPSADGQMNNYAGGGPEGYAIGGDGAQRLSKFDHHIPFIAYDEVDPNGNPIVGDLSGESLTQWLSDKKVVEATFYMRQRVSGAAAPCDPFGAPGTQINDPITIYGLRLGNTGNLVDRGSGGNGFTTCCATFDAPALEGGENAPGAWRMGPPPYDQFGDVGEGAVYYQLPLSDANHPGEFIHAGQDWFDADGDGFEGFSGVIDGTDTALTDGLWAFEYVIRHGTSNIVNSETIDFDDCAGFDGSDEPRNADGDAVGPGWYAVPLDRCLVEELARDPEVKGLVLSSIDAPTGLNTQYWTRDQSGGGSEAYLDVTATVLGDVDNSGAVDVIDVIQVVDNFNLTPASPNWDPEADTDCDNEGTVLDVINVINSFGQSVPAV